MKKSNKKQALRKIAEFQIIIKDTDGFCCTLERKRDDSAQWQFFELAGQVIFKEKYGR